jgi:hypothetical protein
MNEQSLTAQLRDILKMYSASDVLCVLAEIYQVSSRLSCVPSLSGEHLLRAILLYQTAYMIDQVERFETAIVGAKPESE